MAETVGQLIRELIFNEVNRSLNPKAANYIGEGHFRTQLKGVYENLNVDIDLGEVDANQQLKNVPCLFITSGRSRQNERVGSQPGQILGTIREVYLVRLTACMRDTLDNPLDDQEDKLYQDLSEILSPLFFEGITFDNEVIGYSIVDGYITDTENLEDENKENAVFIYDLPVIINKRYIIKRN